MMTSRGIMRELQVQNPTRSAKKNGVSFVLTPFFFKFQSKPLYTVRLQRLQG